jgi:hypothetical protein
VKPNSFAMPPEQPSYSTCGRLLWLPLFSAPLAYTAPRILLPASIFGIFVGVLGGKEAGVKAAIAVWILASWIVSFTYGRSTTGSTPAQPVHVHILSPFGYQSATWTLGTDIGLDQYEHHRDPATGELFVLTAFEDGKETVHLLDRAHWLEAKRQMDNQSVS